jgi:DNA topoisomerase-2
VEGKYAVLPDGRVEITELPIKKWTKQYKEFLEKQIEENKLADFKEYHTK